MGSDRRLTKRLGNHRGQTPAQREERRLTEQAERDVRRSTVERDGITIDIVPEYHEPCCQSALRLDSERFPELAVTSDRVAAMLAELVGASYAAEFLPPEKFHAVTATDSINFAALEVIADELVGNWGLAKLWGGVRLGVAHFLAWRRYSKSGLTFVVEENTALAVPRPFGNFTEKAREIIAAHGFAQRAYASERLLSVSGAAEYLMRQFLLQADEKDFGPMPDRVDQSLKLTDGRHH